MAVLARPDREQLARDHMSMASALAWRYCASGSGEDIDDVRGDALLGLARALKSWNPTGGMDFKLWAYRKMLGAIFDGRRERDHLSRHYRRMGETEAQKLLGIPLDAPVSLNVLINEDGMEPLERIDAIADPLDFTDDVIDRDLGARAREMCDRLPARERFVLLAWCGGLTLEDIGAALGVTESRACQLKSRAIRRLTEALIPDEM